MSSRPSSFTLTSGGALRLYSTTELLRLPPPEWHIHGIMPKGGVVGIYGQPGTCKSFIAMDMAMSIAAGVPWQGRETLSGFGLYVAAEGGGGNGKRAAAWVRHHDVKPSQVDMAWLIESIPVSSDSDEMERLMGRIVDEIDREPAVVVIDTLARCFDGDENQQEDMGRFIGGVDRLRSEFGCTVIVVHHTRLDGERERGNTAFRGACDTMIMIERKLKDGPILMDCTKQKDAEEFHALTFELKVIPEHESCVIIAPTAGATDAAMTVLGQAQDGIAFTRLIKAIKDEAHCSAATAKRALVSLLENSEITKENGIYFRR